MHEQQPWISCYVTDILLSYVREALNSEDQIDYATLFRGIEGFEIPADPKLYLADVRNWIPLSILRELESQCERISSRKDIAYLAAKAYFTPGRKQLPSLFEVILETLDDARSTILFANAWGASQTNYLKLQSFERSPNDQILYLLAQFDGNAGPAIGAINLLRGFVEGVSRSPQAHGEVTCSEEISQLRFDDIVREFPLYSATLQGDVITLHSRNATAPVITAKRICMETETLKVANELAAAIPESVVLNSDNGHIEVLTPRVMATPPANFATSRFAFQITSPGTIFHGPLSYNFKPGAIYDAPYCRFKVEFKERRTAPREEISVERLRRKVSNLLFEQLRHSKQAHTRIVQISTEKHQLAAENLRLRREFQREHSFAGLIGQSKQIQELFALIRSIAETDVTVLVQGETGTGKELIARAVHYNGSRRGKRFVAINCGALSSTLLESELFGHEKGAFTGAIGL